MKSHFQGPYLDMPLGFRGVLLRGLISYPLFDSTEFWDSWLLVWL
jgi:hypothetical protein